MELFYYEDSIVPEIHWFHWYNPPGFTLSTTLEYFWSAFISCIRKFFLSFDPIANFKTIINLKYE